jgi:hypothetical protein
MPRLRDLRSGARVDLRAEAKAARPAVAHVAVRLKAAANLVAVVVVSAALAVVAAVRACR